MRTSTGSGLWSAMQTGDSKTENGAVTHSTSNSASVDFFFKIGALRGAAEDMIINAFWKAFNTNPLIAMRILFYARDVRGGQGERRVFRTILKTLANGGPSSEWLKQNLACIPTYGRFDDLFELVGTPLQNEALSFYGVALQAGDGLAAKWAPREKSSKANVATLLRKHMGLTPKAYRKMLVTSTDVVENKMCAQQWDTIEFSSVPSCAMRIYRKAFERNCKTYAQYIQNLAAGNEKVNSSTLYPHQIVRSIGAASSPEEKILLNEMWNSLPDYLEGNQRNILPIIDTSGSMTTPIAKGSESCMDVSVGLGMYLAERNRGIFRDKFITFSSTPSLQDVQGENLWNRVQSIQSASWGMSTNLKAVFDLILQAAVSNNIKSDEMPEMVLIISDMEFDVANRDYDHGRTNYHATNANVINSEYQRLGYKAPDLVFWNVQARSDANVPVKHNELGVALVSGFSPSIMKQLLSTESLTPESIMMSVVSSDRYSAVRAPEESEVSL